MTLTQSQLDILRTRPSRTKLWLSIYKPNAVLSAQINDSTITKNAQTIYYDNLSSGSPILVENGQEMYIGDTIGANDYGRIRVRSASAYGGTTGTLTVAENSDISWADNKYLTVTDFHEIKAVFPRIIADPADTTKTIWYKDYDIAYSDQNTNLGSFICMGTHYAGFLEGGTGTVYYSATGTYNFGTGSYSYYWFFQGATVTGSTAFTPGWISYNAPGHYTTRLIVSGTACSDVSYRHISIYDRPESGTNTPILQWSLSKLTASKGNGGYNTTIKIFEQVDESVIRDGSLVVIFADEWYENTKVSLGGNRENRTTIVFVGYIVDGTIAFDYANQSIEFEVTSPTGIMKLSEGFSVSLEDIDDPVSRSSTDPGNYPSPWVLIPGLNVQKALYHYLRWHSTVLQTTDFYFNASDRLIQYFDVDRESLYNAVNTGLNGILQGNILSDMQGTIWAEDAPYLSSYSTGSVMEIQNQDWMETPTVSQVWTKNTSYIEMGGIAYTGFGGTSTPYLSGAPGQSPGYYGTLKKIQGLALNSQSDLNNRSGLMYAHENRTYPTIEMSLTNNYRNLDITPSEKYRLVIPANRNPRNKNIDIWTYIENIDWTYNPNKELFLPRVTFSEVVSGVVGETVEIPVIPPGGGFEVPPINIPPVDIPPFSIQNIGYMFVPAIGGAVSGETAWAIEDIRAYGTGPWVGGGGTTAYLGLNFGTDLTTAQGIMAVPYGVKNLSASPFFYFVAGSGAGSMKVLWSAEKLIPSYLSVGGVTLTTVVTPQSDYMLYTVLNSSFSVSSGDVIKFVLSCSNVSTTSGNYFIGWYVLCT